MKREDVIDHMAEVLRRDHAAKHGVEPLAWGLLKPSERDHWREKVRRVTGYEDRPPENRLEG